MRNAALALLLIAACGRAEVPLLEPAQRGSVAAAPVTPPEPGFIGVVVAGDAVDVEPRAAGRVEELLVKPGQRVGRDDALARLDVRAAAHELAAARAALREATRRLARRRELRASRPDAVTPEELDGVRREVEQEKARVTALAEATAEATLRAPFEGVVVETYVAAGGQAGPGRPVVRLAGRAEPRVRFAVPEERAGAVTLGQAVEVRLGGARTLTGKVTGLSPEIDTASRMIYGAASLDAPAEAGGLTTGLLARVFVAPGAPAVEGPR